MSDIAPRPWWTEAEYVAAQLPNGRPNGEVIGSFHPSIRDILSPTQRKANAAHAVACVNAIHAAGITPKALAKDPRCVAKLVEAAKSFCFDELHDEASMLRHVIVSVDRMSAALRACGIEVNNVPL